MKTTYGQLRRLVREALGPSVGPSKTYTVVLEWPDGEIEEFDVGAYSQKEAEKTAAALASEEYRPGFRITHVVKSDYPGQPIRTSY